MIGWVVFKGIGYAAQMVVGTYERITYFYYLYEGNLVRLLSSSRSDYLSGGMTSFLNDPKAGFTFFFRPRFSVSA
ncbi:hypothetical protein MFLO_08992 [Listeria floridensis FSL S10-1187]|uniref:Uncharacterized protein n=1 Tax=Listeria floridensis FSL S10-1187 TaxID=1265817 RepID=A0ABN0REM8_9LIST|nr:hypothetical protein [Listeria floridensis]EUJ31347.1 hypothetical protein MFLO_08992 [Listeria floridensis FSL S10-1187]